MLNQIAGGYAKRSKVSQVCLCTFLNRRRNQSRPRCTGRHQTARGDEWQQLCKLATSNGVRSRSSGSVWSSFGLCWIRFALSSEPNSSTLFRLLLRTATCKLWPRKQNPRQLRGHIAYIACPGSLPDLPSFLHWPPYFAKLSV